MLTTRRETNTWPAAPADEAQAARIAVEGRDLSWRLRRFTPWLLVCSLLTMVVAQVFVWEHVTDDAYIGFRYVMRLLDGEGLTFNPGERVEGFSNPLWIGLLAATVAATSLPVADVARWLGFAAAVLTVVAVFRMSMVASRGREFVAFAYAATIILATPGFHVYATAGLETPLLGMLVSAGALASLYDSARSRLAAASCFGLAAITRPEAPLYALLWWLGTSGPRRLLVGSRSEWLVIVVLAAPFGAYEAFRISYFGEMLPNTFVAKPPGTFGGLFGLPYLSQWSMALGGPLLWILWLLGRPTFDPGLKRLVEVCAGPIIAATVFVVYAMSDWMPFGRFIVPVAPLLAACVGAVLARWTFDRASGVRLPVPLAAMLVASALVMSSFAAWNGELKAYVKNEGNNHVMRGTDQLAVGRWLDEHVVPGTTVATKRLGGISFAAPNLVIWDLLGLTDREQARFINAGNTFGGGLSPVERRFPAIVAAADIPGWGYKTNPETIRWLGEHYQYLRSFPQGNFGTIDLWIAKDRLAQVMRVQP